MSFVRRYTQDPGNTEIQKIEGVVVIDREPPGSIQGAASGVALCVGEFEDGDYNVPSEIFSATDLLNRFGGFGFTYDGVPSNNPCARARKADAAVKPEYWNGNGFISLVNKKFSTLILCRVDTSVGEVQFTRLASVLGEQAFTYNLESGGTSEFTVDGGSPATATFTGVAATTSSAAGTYPTTFTGGETLTLTIDEGTPNQIGPVAVTFTAADQSRAQVISRINAALGYTAATTGATDVIVLTGRQRGTGGHVRVVSVSGALVTTATGFSAALAAGTGNVGNIDQVTFDEIKTVMEAAISGLTIEQTPGGLLRATATTSLLVGAQTATALGFTVGESATATDGLGGVLPAGTRVSNGTTEWVTAQSVAISAGVAGPYTVRVRPSLDDGTALGATTGTVTTMVAPLSSDAYSVDNLLPLTAALSESAIDAAYADAMEATLSSNSITRTATLIWSARASNAVRGALRRTTLRASSEGLAGRICFVRPPLGTTTPTMALSTTSQPGVGAYRSDAVIYAFPGAATFVPQIARRGLAGGAGFSADGIIDVGYDSWEACICSNLAPEENPGQRTTFASGVIGVERGNPSVQDLRIDDYVAFKAAGIAALIMDDGIATIQSGKTSVDPQVFPNLQNIARRRMAFYIQDSITPRLKAFGKKLSTKSRRSVLVGEVDAFMASLVSANNEASQRIDSYVLDAISGNTPEALGAGIFRLQLKSKTLASLDDIVLDTEIGENVVTVTER